MRKMRRRKVGGSMRSSKEGELEWAPALGGAGKWQTTVSKPPAPDFRRWSTTDLGLG